MSYDANAVTCSGFFMKNHPHELMTMGNVAMNTEMIPTTWTARDGLGTALFMALSGWKTWFSGVGYRNELSRKHWIMWSKM